MNRRSFVSTLSPLLGVFLATLAACSDVGTSPDTYVICGAWRWIRSVGGFAPHVITPPSGTTFIDVYSPAGIYLSYRNDTLMMTGRFALTKKDQGILVSYTDVRKYAGDWSEVMERWVRVEGDTLLLSDNGMDLYRHTFVRLR
jgi:hypothetical protein